MPLDIQSQKLSSKSLMEVHSFTEYHGNTDKARVKYFKSYAEFAIHHYGSGTNVVFDTYVEGPTIKNNTQQRR